jgi:hypothetical protein
MKIWTCILFLTKNYQSPAMHVNKPYNCMIFYDWNEYFAINKSLDQLYERNKFAYKWKAAPKWKWYPCQHQMNEWMDGLLKCEQDKFTYFSLWRSYTNWWSNFYLLIHKCKSEVKKQKLGKIFIITEEEKYHTADQYLIIFTLILFTILLFLWISFVTQHFIQTCIK